MSPKKWVGGAYRRQMTKRRERMNGYLAVDVNLRCGKCLSKILEGGHAIEGTYYYYCPKCKDERIRADNIVQQCRI